MRIKIKPITVNDKVTEIAEVSLAISSSVAIRVVPVVDDIPIESAGFGLVGSSADGDVSVLMDSIVEPLSRFFDGRNI